MRSKVTCREVANHLRAHRNGALGVPWHAYGELVHALHPRSLVRRLRARVRQVEQGEAAGMSQATKQIRTMGQRIADLERERDAQEREIYLSTRSALAC